ncbi:ABC transporter substrate-binding protein [Rhizobium sp. C4]|uniref:ABC transporter substrate-binding protein n=1 Tax=Rhizobium sp. C4 TaxID=1349800 RepID=UPI001E4FA7FF|nr:ABC transporter substrate-binding protein [Rhizobium sp. C4]MCD2172099.1 ABC transporter substrate-binding protein [Rhizobium sp. C4]
MNRRTLLSAGVSLALGALALPAFAFAGDIPAKVEAPVTISYYNYNLATAGIGGEATKKLIAEFEAANPNIKVNGVGVTSAEISTRVQADVAAGRGPDVAQMVFSDFDFMVHNLGAVALEDIIPTAELKAHFEGISPKGLALGVYEGKTYGLAYTFSTPVLFYNADLFRKAGLDPENPPKTWAEVKVAAKAIVDKAGAEGIATGIFGPSAGDWLFQGLIRSNGASVLSKDRKTLTFASAEGIEAVSMLQDLYKSGVYSNLDISAAMDAMAAGTVGMYLQTSAVQGYLVKGAKGNFELRASTMPRFGDKPVRPNNSGSALVIMSHDPVKQRAAWELMKFMTSKHAYTVITSQIGYLPLRTDIVNDPQYLGEWVKDHPLIQPNLQQLAVLEPWESFPGANYRQIVKTMMDGAEQAVFGGGDPAKAMKDAQANAQKLMPAAMN